MDVTIRALLVDDEAPGLVNLRCALADSGRRWRIVGEFASAGPARAALSAGGDDAVDVGFLDIRMPHESGLMLARELAARDEPPLVIFVTAYDAHALEAFDVHALDYLLKPVDDARLEQAMRRAEAMLAQRQRAGYARAMRDCLADDGASRQRRLSVRSAGRIDSIDIDDILWFEAAGNYVQLHMPGRTVLHRVTLAALEKRLDPAQFVRVHRGAIVRIAQLATLVATVDGGTFTLRCGDRVAVSERYVAAARALMRDG
jgi:DNA-binding LytR/AlgR family response regulator